MRPGAYAPAAVWDGAPDRQRHLLRIRAASRLLGGNIVFSHESAAAIHGIPIIGAWPDAVRASFDGGSGMASRVGVRWSRATWEAGDVVTLAGVHVTSPLRTALDLARTTTLAQGVVACDHVIAAGVERARLVGWCGTHRAHGIANARRALGIARGLSESPLESLSLARFAERGIPAPEQQHELVVGGQRYRVDFFWPEFGVVGEADGRGKYTAPADLWREKRREDTIRTRVPRFVRWTWADAWASERLRRLLAGAGIPSV